MGLRGGTFGVAVFDRIHKRMACFAALVLLAATAPTAVEAQAERRVALVIGNAKYRHVTPLINPENDANLIATTLRNLGFRLVGGDVILNLDKAGMDRVVQEFGRESQGADIALFYYAGHGVQVREANYLVPVTAKPVREADADFHMLSVSLVLRQLESAGTRLNIVILDACRNNPFGQTSGRMVQRGLARVDAPSGTLISFATQPGAVAQDGYDGNSPYARALAATMLKPGLDLFGTFNEVGLTVMTATKGDQQPWMSASPISGRFQFVPGGTQTTLAALPPGAASAPVVPAPVAPAMGTYGILTGRHEQQLRDIATKKSLIIPEFVIRPSVRNVSAAFREFVGVWVSDQGFNRFGREAMIIITNVDAEGNAEGYFSFGPPMPRVPKHRRFPANTVPIQGKVIGNRVTFKKPRFTLTTTLDANRSIKLTNQLHSDGTIVVTTASPVWLADSN